jgi:hypothetical protein
MDPNACYLIILEATREHDYAKAREYALILKHWLEGGGFYPKEHEPSEVVETLGRILRPACSASALRFAFRRMSCIHCDAGQDIDSLEDAIDEGWYKIEPTVDMQNTTHIGLCPECRRKQDDDR